MVTPSDRAAMTSVRKAGGMTMIVAQPLTARGGGAGV